MIDQRRNMQRRNTVAVCQAGIDSRANQASGYGPALGAHGDHQRRLLLRSSHILVRTLGEVASDLYVVLESSEMNWGPAMAIGRIWVCASGHEQAHERKLTKKDGVVKSTLGAVVARVHVGAVVQQKRYHPRMIGVRSRVERRKAVSIRRLDVCAILKQRLGDRDLALPGCIVKRREVVPALVDARTIIIQQVVRFREVTVDHSLKDGGFLDGLAADQQSKKQERNMAVYPGHGSGLKS